MRSLTPPVFHEDTRQDENRPLHTVIALFDDTIEAEHTLMTLRRTKQPAEQISVILRERVLDLDETTPYRAVLSRVVAASALDVVGSWLQGLASLVLPDRATYLAAGPIGVVLATIRDARQQHEEADLEPTPRRSVPTRQLTRALLAFGFERDEASYVEQRVVAGSPLIAVTSNNVETLRAVHRIFSRNAAVYIGLARTEPSISSQASRLLMTGPQAGGSVVIADAMSPLRRLVDDPRLHRGPWDLRGREVVSRYGEPIGKVDDLLFEPRSEPPAEGQSNGMSSENELIPRYMIVRFGGVLGVARQRVAIPGERVDISDDGVVVEITHEELVSAPRFDALTPLSRQDEATIRRHFSAPFYWINGTETP
jgi:hypothetical protein